MSNLTATPPPQRESDWYELNALDAWFFRDGTPFDRGEDHTDARSLFPPVATSISGALRYGLARRHGWTSNRSWCDAGQPACLQEVLGDGPHKLGQLSFQGPLLSEDGSPLFPMPLHVLGFTETGDRFPTFKPTDWLIPGDTVSSDLDNVVLPRPAMQSEKPPFAESTTDFFLTQEGFQQVVNGQLPTAKCCRHRDQLYALEPRVGIARQRGLRVVEEGGLYNPNFIRPQPGIGVLIGVKGLPVDWTVPPTIALGGESRMAGVAPLGKLDLPTANFDGSTTSGNTLAVMTLITPARFDQTRDGQRLPWYGQKPGGDAGQLSQVLDGRVLTVAVNRPQKIGGWNSIDGAPEPMKPYAPAGTVWWLDLKSPPKDALILVGDRTAHGFGLAALCRPNLA